MTTGNKYAKIIAFLFFASLTVAGAAVSGIDKKIEYKKQSVAILSNGKEINLILEVAETFAQQQQGLMHRKALDGIDGMLFLFSEEEIVSMWMKNTLIPLDMVFADKAGRVVHIVYSVEPMLEKAIPSQVPSKMVIELPAGKANEHGIKIGDKINVAAAE